MPRQRFLNMPANARLRLLDLALEEFAERGYDEASLNEILARAGISKGAYYYYFDDKEDLFATAIESAMDSMLAQMPLPAFDRLTREEFWPAVERAVESWAETYEARMPLFRAALLLDETRRRSPRFEPVLAKTRAVWRTLIAAGQRVGCVRKDIPNDLLVRLVEANDLVLDTVFLARHPRLTRSAIEQHIRLVLDTFKRLLALEGPPAWSERSRASRSRRG